MTLIRLGVIYVPSSSLDPAFIVDVEIKPSDPAALEYLLGDSWESITGDHDATMKINGMSAINGMQRNARINSYLDTYSDAARGNYPFSSRDVICGPVVIIGLKKGGRLVRRAATVDRLLQCPKCLAGLKRRAGPVHLRR